MRLTLANCLAQQAETESDPEKKKKRLEDAREAYLAIQQKGQIAGWPSVVTQPAAFAWVMMQDRIREMQQPAAAPAPAGKEPAGPATPQDPAPEASTGKAPGEAPAAPATAAAAPAPAETPQEKAKPETTEPAAAPKQP